MPAMKVTLSAAMRARDVSRPRDEQLADAEAAEASLASNAPANVSPADAVRRTDAGDGAREDTGWESAERGDAERRRRVPRDASRRGRPSR